ncbi:MAG: DNA mismatch repair protein MutS, partial [Rhodobacteraceae bacterium]|nr:DNA mismatch repair protein MutS [Paracoccaceae bacterium]
PRCGVPGRAAEGYMLTLIRKGFRVAQCEQMENPAEAKKRGSKSVVRREVVRLVTPGTLTEDSLLEARRHNFLTSYAELRDQAAIAWADISTGMFHVMPLAPVRLGPELARLAPSELIVAETDDTALASLVKELGISLTPLSRASFDSSASEKRLCELFSVTSLDGFGGFTRAELSAMGALIDYLQITQKGKLPPLQAPIREAPERIVQIDAATRRNLELTRSLSGGLAGSLLSVIDRTATPGGARLLEQRLSSPSRDLETIHTRLDAVTFAVDQSQLSADLVGALRKTPDLNRALSRLSLGRGGPRDLAAIRNGLQQTAAIAQFCPPDLPDLLKQATQTLIGFEDLSAMLDAALIPEPPLLARDGDFIATGHNPELDEVRTLRDEGRSVIIGLQQKYADHTGIASLKIKHNNVLGYFIDTTSIHAKKMQTAPFSETYIHRQTTANQVRFTTVELSEIEARILNAGNQALEIESRLYDGLKAAVLDSSAQLHAAAHGLAEIDLTVALADLARGESWCRPKVDNSRQFTIVGGRHPVVEHALHNQSGDSFIANDCDLSADKHAAIWLLTGPNMAGKSTFLRQNALIALLAQMGSFVPAKTAHIGTISQLFSRVGASDDLARGRSTFMVEMVETAAILNQADDRALVILDEIGRGTATYDGLSIAWATLEHLHEVNKSRALFATHYHELTALAGSLDGVENATVAVKEWDGEIIFLHEVHQGAADRSYGVQVAQLAGLPDSVVKRARVILDQLEKNSREGKAGHKAMIDDLPLFAAAPPPQKPTKSKALDLLNDSHPDNLTPLQALDLLYKLKEAAKS